jgi:electron transport complex protein RnfD
LEDLVLGGHPGPIGASSAIATLVGGLFLLYRGLIDYRIPLLGCLAAYFAMLLLPLPYSVGEGVRPWQSLLLSSPRADWATAITFVNYQVVASPLLFAALFLATSPSVRPVSFRGRVVFAMALGIASAAAQLYVSVPHGPYVALLVVSLLTPWLDRWLRARPIV